MSTTGTTTSHFDILAATAPAVPAAPSWASMPATEWACASADELSAFHEHLVGTAGGQGTGIGVTISQEVVAAGARMTAQPVVVLISGPQESVAVQAQDLRALAALLVAAAEVIGA